MEDLKQRLNRELDALEEQITTLRDALKVQPDYGMGEGDPAITQWEFDQAMLERQEAHAEKLRQALERLEDGTYGMCEQCGRPIHPDRLAVLPDTTLCMACAQKT